MIRTIAPLVASLAAVALAERVMRWWYRLHPVEAARPLESDSELQRGPMWGLIGLGVGVLCIWITLRQVAGLADQSGILEPVAWLVVGLLASRQGLRWLLHRTVLSVGPRGLLIPGRGRLSWSDLSGVVVIGRNIIVVSDAPRVGTSKVRERLLQFSSDARGYRVWALPQTQSLSTRDFIALVGQLELADATFLPSRHSDAAGLWRASMRRLRRRGASG